MTDRDDGRRIVDPRRLVDERVARLLSALASAGEETRIVGGAVRNLLMGRRIADIDLATTLLPADVTARAGAAGLKAVPTGIRHGTVTVVVEGRPFEVTTLRADIETDGRHAMVRFGRDFAEDARRRDFTINALSMAADGTIHDYAGGLEDLAAQRVRFIGDPRQRIREDYLRTLRLFRFHAAYGSGRLDPEGVAAAVAERAGLTRLSRERVRAELMKLLVAPGASAVVAAMSDTGILEVLLGGIATPARFERAAAIEAARGDARDPMLRLAAATTLVVEDAARLREALRLSNEESETLGAVAAALQRLHGCDRPPRDTGLQRLLFEHGSAATSAALILAQADSRTDIADPDWAAALDFVARSPRPQLPIGGADVLARGVASGSAVGAILKDLQARWIRAGFPRDASTLSKLLDDTIGASDRR